MTTPPASPDKRDSSISAASSERAPAAVVDQTKPSVAPHQGPTPSDPRHAATLPAPELIPPPLRAAGESFDPAQSTRRTATPPELAADAAATEIASPPRELADPRTIPLIQEQLELLHNRTFTWQGEGWPGQPLRWDVTEREAQPGESQDRSWESTVTVHLPRLGEVRATLQINGKTVQLSLAGAEAASLAELQERQGDLHQQLASHGLSLARVEVRHE